MRRINGAPGSVRSGGSIVPETPAHWENSEYRVSESEFPIKCHAVPTRTWSCGENWKKSLNIRPVK